MKRLISCLATLGLVGPLSGCHVDDAKAPSPAAPAATQPTKAPPGEPHNTRAGSPAVALPLQPAVAAPLQPASPAEMPLQPATAAPATQHDPAHPPIDCPLRKQGLDPTHLRPFEDVEKYIAFLERPDREVWQRPDAVVAALGLQGDETVVDLGAGSGYFAFRFAAALPRGTVIAADTEPEMVRHMHHKTMVDGLANLRATVITPDDPAIPANADVVFVCDVLHHVADRATWLAKLVTELRAGARLVLIEFKEGDLPQGPPEAVKISRAELVTLVTGAGLVLTAEQPELLPYQTFLVFTKP